VALIKEATGPRVSLYLPLAAPPDVAQNDVLCRQAIDAVGKRLETYRLEAQELACRSARLEASLRESVHSAPPRGTLACFESGSAVRCNPLARRLPFLVSVGKRFALRPLLGALETEGAYRVVTVSTKQVGMFEGDSRGLSHAPQGALPTSLEDALGREKTEKQLRVRGTGPAGSTPVYYSHHDSSQERKIDLRRFYHAIAAALNERLASDAIPLVLAADATHQSGLRAELRVPGLIEAPVIASPDSWTEAQLHEHAWPHVERARRSLGSTVRESWERARNAGKGLDLLDDIGAAAVAGRIRRLWLEGERVLSGGVDPATGRVLGDVPDDDVLEALAEIVICRGGDVRIVTGSALPSSTGAAAELR
jgi:hypothetical protein